jgi:ABC-type uncharacterized transport system substrate-binding protein
MPVVGFLRSTSAAPFERFAVAFRQGLSGAGFVEGQNVAIEYRYADNQRDRLPALAADLVRRRVAVIVCNGNAAGAVKASTPTIPIVFVTGEDPVRQGLVSSIARPSGNLTGVTFFGPGVLGAKRVELLRDLVPKAAVIAVMIEPDAGGAEAELRDAEVTSRALGLQVVAEKAASGREFEAAFAKFAHARANALLVAGGGLFATHRQAIIELASRHALPAIYSGREYVEAGGLISYAASFAGAYRQAGVYAGRILKGAKPSDLPVLQPTTFELVINLRTAKALGLDVPPSIQLRADDVIE